MPPRIPRWAALVLQHLSPPRLLVLVARAALGLLYASFEEVLAIGTLRPTGAKVAPIVRRYRYHSISAPKILIL